MKADTVLCQEVQASWAQLCRPWARASSMMFWMKPPRSDHCGGPMMRSIETNSPTGAS